MDRIIRGKLYKLFCVGVVFLTVWLQAFLIPGLPAKYFYDSNAILAITNDNYYRFFDNSYMFTGKFFNAINIFGFTTFNEWAILISTIFTIITIMYLSKYKEMKLSKCIFIYATIALANIYIFRISKDIIQLLFWLAIFAIVCSKKIKDKNKVLLTVIVFSVEANCFRKYY